MQVEERVTQKKPLCSTGIEELDIQMNGGIPLGSTVLVTGCSGSGKTTMCMQFLFNGAKRGERSVFFTITEPLFKLTKNVEGFKFYDKKLIESGMVNLIDLRIISERLGLDTEKYSVEDAGALLDILKDIAEERSIPTSNNIWLNFYHKRHKLLKHLSLINTMNILNIITSIIIFVDTPHHKFFGAVIFYGNG